jgi:integrase
MPPAVKAFGRMLERLDRLGFTSPDHCLWWACQWNQLDPTTPMSRWDTAWHALREKADLPGLRCHDLRHTIITELSETSTPDMVIQSIAGHVTKKMLDLTRTSGPRRSGRRLKPSRSCESRSAGTTRPRATRKPFSSPLLISITMYLQ